MYNMIKSTIETKVLTDTRIDGVIPAGTAIQNARTSYLGDTLTRDGYHMSNIHGRWITACTWFAYITGANVESVDWSIGSNSKRDMQVVIDSVKAALNDPFNVTQITTQKPST